MGSGLEDAQPVEIDWNDYFTYTNEWGEAIMEHDIKGCHIKMELIWRDVQTAIDVAKEHHEVCPLNN